jgi:hypothetical protein
MFYSINDRSHNPLCTKFKISLFNIIVTKHDLTYTTSFWITTQIIHYFYWIISCKIQSYSIYLYVVLKFEFFLDILEAPNLLGSYIICFNL